MIIIVEFDRRVNLAFSLKFNTELKQRKLIRHNFQIETLLIHRSKAIELPVSFNIKNKNIAGHKNQYTKREEITVHNKNRTKEKSNIKMETLNKHR